MTIAAPVGMLDELDWPTPQQSQPYPSGIEENYFDFMERDWYCFCSPSRRARLSSMAVGQSCLTPTSTLNMIGTTAALVVFGCAGVLSLIVLVMA